MHFSLDAWPILLFVCGPAPPPATGGGPPGGSTEFVDFSSAANPSQLQGYCQGFICQGCWGYPNRLFPTVFTFQCTYARSERRQASIWPARSLLNLFAAACPSHGLERRALWPILALLPRPFSPLAAPTGAPRARGEGRAPRNASKRSSLVRPAILKGGVGAQGVRVMVFGGSG